MALVVFPCSQVDNVVSVNHDTRPVPFTRSVEVSLIGAIGELLVIRPGQRGICGLGGHLEFANAVVGGDNMVADAVSTV